MHARRILTAAVALVGLAAGASADILTFNGTDLVSSVTIYAPGMVSHGKTVQAGRYRVGWNGTPYLSYCVDIDAWAGNDANASAAPLASLGPNANRVGYLFETYGLTVPSAQHAAALSVAIWELLNESPGNSLNVLTGSFAISGNSTVASLAAGYLNGLPESPEPATELRVLHSECKQDQLINIYEPVPEPATAALLGMGTVGVLLRRRRAA